MVSIPEPEVLQTVAEDIPLDVVYEDEFISGECPVPPPSPTRVGYTFTSWRIGSPSGAELALGAYEMEDTAF